LEPQKALLMAQYITTIWLKPFGNFEGETGLPPAISPMLWERICR